MDDVITDAIEEAEEEPEEEGDLPVDMDGFDREFEEEENGDMPVQEESTTTTSTTQQSSDEDVSEYDVGDEKLDQLIEKQQASITVVGCGGAGCNTINQLTDTGIENATTVAVNTDAQDLRNVHDADSRLLIGENETGGKGAGSNPGVGEAAAFEDLERIQKIVQGEDMVFVTAGMGGGTGTGAAPVVAQAANEAGALTIAIVTTPFHSEGKVRRVNAEKGLNSLRNYADTVIVVPNDRLLDVVPNQKLRTAFRASDQILVRSVEGITELINTNGLINVDFADVRTIMENGDVALIGVGESDSNEKKRDSVKSALNTDLLDVDISEADNALVNVTGGDEMSVKEAEGVADYISNEIEDEARIIWGANTEDGLGDTIRVMVVLTGVESPQIYSEQNA